MSVERMHLKVAGLVHTASLVKIQQRAHLEGTSLGHTVSLVKNQKGGNTGRTWKWPAWTMRSASCRNIKK